MNRQRAILIALPILLLAWVALWRMTKTPAGGRPFVSPAAPVEQIPSAKKEATEEDRQTEASSAKVTSYRDPFRISQRAMEILRQREEEHLRKEQEAKEAQRAALEAQAAKPEVAAPAVVLPQMSVQGIILGAQHRAIINRKIVKVGDTIEGAQVTRIEKGKVTVKFQGQIFTLTTATAQRRSPQEGRSGPWGSPPYGGSGEGYGPGRWGGL